MIAAPRKVVKKQVVKKKVPAEEKRVVRMTAGDPENEARIIATAWSDKKARRRLLIGIHPESFISPKHSDIWSVLREMREKKLEFDLPTAKKIGGDGFDDAYFSELLDIHKEPVQNIDFHVDTLRWDRAKVEVVRGPLSQLLEDVRDTTVGPTQIRTLLKRCLEMTRGYGTQEFIRDAAQLAKEDDRELTRMREGVAVYPFGIDALDYYDESDPMPDYADSFLSAGKRVPRIIPGTAPGLITLISGLPGTGKSTSVARAMLSICGEDTEPGDEYDGRKVLYGAWELPERVTLRMLGGMKCEFHRTDIQMGNFSAEQQRELVGAMARLDGKIRFFELKFGKAREEGNFNDRMLDTIHRVVEDAGCDIFVMDLARRAMKETGPDDEEQFLFRLQEIAKETRTHIVIVHQLKSKEVEASKTKVPARHLLKGSSAWYEVPDTVIVWHCPAQWDPALTNDHLIAYLFKQRYGEGKPMAVRVEYDPSYAVFGRGTVIPITSNTGKRSFEDDFLGPG